MLYGNQGSAATAYKRNEILTASKEKLVVLLYAGAIQNMERAKIALDTPGQNTSAKVGECLGKAMAILGELRAALDREKGGDIAVNLDNLYEFCLDRIYSTNIDRSSKHIQASIDVMKTLKEGWDAIIPA